MKLILKPLALIVSIVSAVFFGCARESQQDCVANFKGSGLNLKVSLVTGSSYRMELCGDSKVTYPAFTVYGAATESGIADSSILNRFRLSHIVANRSGDAIEVSFASDLYFVIFADTNSQSGYQYSNSNELIRGSLSQVSIL